MKKIMIVITVFLSIMLQAQTGYVCTYKVFENKDSLTIHKNDKPAQKNAMTMLKNAMLLAETLTYQLVFDKEEGYFELNERLINDEISGNYLYPVAKAMVGEGVFYQKISKNISLCQKEALGELFLIKDVLKKDWIITNEKKMIGKYHCVKAKLDCESCKSKLEVWFCPDIPFSFGPFGYGGLPGIIVEIKKKVLTIRLDTIKESKSVKIKKLNKGINISQKELNEKYRQLRSR